MKVFGISAKLIPIGVHFFLMYAGICPMAIFGSTIAKQFGFSTSAVGLIFFFVPLGSLFCRVILGMVADKYHLLKTIKTVCLMTCAVTVLLLSFLPKRGDASVPTTVWCGQNETTVENRQFDEAFCQSAQKAQTDVCENYVCGSAKIQKVKDGKTEIPWPRCSTDRNSTCSVICAKADDSLGSELLMPYFWFLFTLYATFGAGYYVAVTFSDTICFQLIEEKTYLYGRLRVPGSFGWGLGGFLTGILIDHFSDSEEKNYQPMFVFVITAFLVDVLWSSKLKIDKSTSEKFRMEKIYRLFSRFDVVVFALWSFLGGFFQQIIWQYSFWYLDDISTGDDRDNLKTLQGFLSLSSTVTGDVISFSTSGWLFKNWGYKNCMTIAMFLSAIRFFSYSILSRPFWAIPISSLDGIIYGLQYTLITSYCNSIAAPGTEATVQAVFNSIFDGIGTSLGGLCGGFFYSWYGGSSMFRINCLVSIVGFVLHLVTRYATTLAVKKEVEIKS
ncbi:hypothetical protein V9T40_005144 [Parthenolecanium corni]|uniref:Major facilitator superfamily associated domain-containing protein n=1 Tax=Parthenolecanium corni TaxID=536013 RepID=A0AAN9TUH4_9HEMI